MKKKYHPYVPKWRPGQNVAKVRRRKALARFIIILIVILILFLGWVAFELLRPAGKSGKEGFLYVRPTTTLQQVEEQLTNEIGLQKLPLAAPFSKMLNVEKKLRPGRYAVKGNMSLTKLYRVLTVANETPLKLTFNNIRTQQQLVEKLSAPLAFEADSLNKLIENEAFCDSLGFTTETIRCLFIPDTYEVYWTISPNELIHKIVTNYHRFWNEERLKKAQKEQLTPVQICIIASIVEEESAKKDEYADIAGLYINRLRRGMKLQADPTLKYASGDFSAKRVAGALLQTNSPYNTYLHEGLPPGPIRFPQKSTLDAVLNFTHHNFYYMCAKSDFSGYHDFTQFYTQHLLNAQRYQQALNERNIH